MKGNNILYIVIITFFTFTCCEKESESPKEKIIGTWEWVKSIDPRFGVVITPTTEGYYETRIFLANDTVEIFINDILQNKYSYCFKLMKEVIPVIPETNSTEMMLIINDNPSFYSIENDTLIIDYSYIDGWKNYYNR